MSWRRILLLTVCMLAAIIGATWFVLQRTGAATGIVRSFIGELLATEFDLQRAQVDLFGGNLTLEEFAVSDPQRPGSMLIEAETLQLDVETDPMGGVLAIHEVVADGLVLDIDLTEGRAPNFAQLLRQQVPGGDSALEVVTPARVTRARARVRVDSEVDALEFTQVELSLKMAMLDDGSVDRQRGVIGGSARFENLGVAVALLGDLDLNTGMCRLQAKIADLVVDAPFLRRLLPLLHTELAADVALGHMHHLTLHLDLPLTEGEVVAGAAFEFSEVHCALPELPVPLRGASVRGVVSTRDGGTGQFTGERLLPNGETELVAKVTNFLTEPRLEVRGKGRGIRLDSTVESALRSFPVSDRVVDALRPTAGTADFDLYLRDPRTVAEIFDLDLYLNGVSMAYHGFGKSAERVSFPLPLVNATGRVHLRDNSVSLEDVAAELAPHAGGGEVSMSGRVDIGRDDLVSVSIDLFAPRLQCTPELRSAFSTLVRDDGSLYDQFSPTGTAAVRLRIRPDEVGDTDWQVTVDPLGAGVTWDRFPLPIADVRGRIVARAEGLELDLRSQKNGCRATVRGRLLAPPGSGDLAGGRIDMRIEAKNVPLDADLRRASTTLAPQLDRVWDELQPGGAADTDLVVRRSDGDAEIVYDMRFDFVDARCLPRSFPMPVTGITGEVFVNGRGQYVDVHVDTVRGMLQEKAGRGCDLAIVGTIEIEDGYREDLTAVLRNLELTREFGDVLESTGAAGRGTWEVLQPSGLVDVISRQQRTEGQDPLNRYTVLLRDARSDAEMLPLPATNLSGELEIANGELRFDDIRARMGQALVTCRDGRVGPTEDRGRTEVAFVVSSERFQLDDTFARLFVGPLKQAVLDRQLRGLLNINGLSLRFLLPMDGSADTPIEVVIAGSVEALEVEMLLGARLQDVNGIVTFDESRVTRNGGTLRGNVTRGSLMFFGHPILELQSRFAADARRFVLNDLSFDLHGGRVRGRDGGSNALVYELPEAPEAEGSLAADIEFEGMSLREFLQHCGLRGTQYYGTAKGAVRLDRLYGYDFVDMRGRGSIQILDGNLGTVPLFTAIYALMEESNRPRFESLSAAFEVEKRKIRINDLTLKSPLVAVNGGGTMSMEGYLDIQLTTDSLFGGSADLLLLPGVFQWVTSSLVRVHLFGHVRNLQAEQRWFTEGDPGRRRLLPVPPRLDKPRRPGF